MGHLSVAACRKLRAPARRREVPDGGGLYLIVQPSGHKSWALRYRARSGKVVKMTLGPLGEKDTIEPVVGQPLSPRSARILAEKIKIDRESGKDPIAEHRATRRRIVIDEAKKRSTTFLAMARQWVEQEQRDEKQLRNWRKQARVLGLIYRPDGGAPEVIRGSLADRWSERPVADLAADDIFSVIDEAHTVGLPGRLARVRSVSVSRRIELAKALSTFLKYLRRRRLITGEALAGVDVPRRTKARERTFSHDEVKKIWNESAKLDLRYAAIIRLLILTGQRIGEVSGMRWSELSASKKAIDTWALPAERSKNKREHIVHLVAAAREIIEAQPSLELTHVFAGREKTTPISGFGKMKRRLDDLVKLKEPWKFHDIRRTVYTNMVEMGIPTNVVAAVVNHTSEAKTGIAAVYDRSTLAEPKRRALEAWASRLAEIVSGKKKGNVLRLRA